MKNFPEKKELFSVQISPVTFSEFISFIKDSIEKEKKIVIFYHNIYVNNLANKNPVFAQIINSADIIHADGTGIWLGAKLTLDSYNFERFNLTDYGYEYIKFCNDFNLKIFLLGNTDSILRKTYENLISKFPNLKIAGIKNGFSDVEDQNLVENINNSGTDILLVGMGTPKQEKWIYANKDKLNCKVIHAVGDLFTLFAGEKIRGPLFLRKIGFEWLFRLIKNPFRYFNRYVVGIPLFFFRIITCKIFKRG